MKRILLLTVMIALMCINQAFSQDITTDTTLANKNIDLVDSLLNEYKFDSIVNILKRTKEIYTKYFGKKSLQVANCYDRYSAYYLYNFNYDSAFIYKTKSLNLYKKILGENNTMTAERFGNIGLLFSKLHNFDSSFLYLDKSIDIFKKHNNVEGLIYPILNLANLYSELGNFDSSYFYLNYDLNLISKYHKKDDFLNANLYQCKGNMYICSSQYDSSLYYFYKSLDFVKKMNEVELSSYLYSIANAYYLLGIYDSALYYIDKTININNKYFSNDNIDLAMDYDLKSNIFSASNQYNLALEYIYKSLNIKFFLKSNTLDIGLSYINLGANYANLNNFEEGIKYTLKGLEYELSIYGPNHPNIIVVYNNLGSNYNFKGDLDSSLFYYQKALDLCNKIFPDQNFYTEVLAFNIGDTYFQLKNYDEALKYFKISAQLAIKIFGSKNLDLAQSYNRFVSVFYDKGKLDSALLYCQKSLCSNLRDYNDTTNIFANPNLDNYIDKKQILITIGAEAEILCKLQYPIKNISNLQRLQTAFNLYKSFDDFSIEQRKKINNQMDLYWLNSIIDYCQKESVGLCYELAKINAESNQKTKIDSLKKYKDYAFYYSERNKSSILLQLMTSADALKFSGIPDSLINKEHLLKNNIAAYTNLKNNSESDSVENYWNAMIFDVNQQYDSLIKYFEVNYPKYYALKFNFNSVNPSELSKKLKPHSAIIEYSINDSKYGINDSSIFIFVITRKNYQIFKVPLPDSLDIKIDFLRQSISNKNLIIQDQNNKTNKSVKYYVSHAFDFYNLLFPDLLKKMLKRSNIKDITIIPDGDLARLPFESLLTKSYNKMEWKGWEKENRTKYFSKMPYLINKYNISYSYSATLLSDINFSKKNKNKHAKYDWIGFAPVFDDTKISGLCSYTQRYLHQNNSDDSNFTRSFSNGMYINPLPATKDEVQSIFNLFNKYHKSAKMNLYATADEQAVKSPEIADYKIIHIATHGDINELNPEQSAIILAQDTTQINDSLNMMLGNVVQQNEGFLYESEIYNLNLNADLVVLSACETGLGKVSKGEGLIGLTRALLYAGADNLIVSLWSVSDVATQQLMVEFYKNLLQQNNQKEYSEPLRKAKLEMIKQGYMPYFWSPFILIGE